ncbi:MAG: hypothetical protein FWG61_10050 [Firmicutes bacterium]|nr:hypothetical protein [Bacillota bacterium]
MNKFFEIEKLFNAIDFSAGREKAVWEKILVRLSRNADTPSDTLSIEKFDKVGGGLASTTEHCDKSEEFQKNK